MIQDIDLTEEQIKESASARPRCEGAPHRSQPNRDRSGNAHEADPRLCYGGDDLAVPRPGPLRRRLHRIHFAAAPDELGEPGPPRVPPGHKEAEGSG